MFKNVVELDVEYVLRLVSNDYNVVVCVNASFCVIFIKIVLCSVLSAIVSVANGQYNGGTNSFAPGEAQRLYDLLDGLGCIGNSMCELSDFTTTKPCNYRGMPLRCTSQGRVMRM